MPCFLNDGPPIYGGATRDPKKYAQPTYRRQGHADRNVTVRCASPPAPWASIRRSTSRRCAQPHQAQYCSRSSRMSTAATIPCLSLRLEDIVMKGA
jgi:hypothetical protein